MTKKTHSIPSSDSHKAIRDSVEALLARANSNNWTLTWSSRELHNSDGSQAIEIYLEARTYSPNSPPELPPG